MFKLVALCCACLALAACATSKSRNGGSAFRATFEIAGGQVITLQLTDAGPPPAENDQVKIVGSGFGIKPSKESEKSAELFWGFDFETKSSQLKLEAVTVEEVFPGKTAKTLVQDISPELKGGIWSGTAKPIPANRNSIPWLYTADGSIYIFRFTIKPVAEAPFVLYQAAWFSSPAKLAFRQLIEKIERD